jgi:hypothetical protein
MLGASLNDQERSAIPAILSSIFGNKTSKGVQFGANAIRLDSLEVNQPNDPFGFSGIPRDELVKWVSEFKIKDDRDRDRSGNLKSDEQIAQRVMFAIQANPQPWLDSKNPTGLAAFLGATGLAPESSERLLLAVVRTWAAFVREGFPSMIGFRLSNSIK